MNRICLTTEQCYELLKQLGLSQQAVQSVTIQTLLDLLQTSYRLGYDRDLIKTTYKEQLK